MATPLLEFLRAASDAEKREAADLAGTSLAYLYQLATCVRPRPSAALAVHIEDATRELARRNPSLPVVTVRDLASMCAVEGL